MTITITRQDEGAEDLRQAARSCKNVAQARRLPAIALVPERHSRIAAATAAGMDQQSLRDWVHRFNAEGPAGLLDRPRSGRSPRMKAEQLQALDEFFLDSSTHLGRNSWHVLGIVSGEVGLSMV